MTRGEEKKDTSTKILSAAEELFAEMGFDAVSMRDIAQMAGVNKALVFYHHTSKEELFEKVLERYYQSQRDALSKAADIEGDIRVRFHHVLDQYIDFISTHRRYPRLIQNVVSGHPRHLHFIQKSMSPLLEWTSEMLGDIAPQTGPLATRHFFVTISASVINYFTYTPAVAPAWGDDPLTPDAIEERRAHLHWLVDVCLDQLVRERSLAPLRA